VLEIVLSAIRLKPEPLLISSLSDDGELSSQLTKSTLS